MKFALTTRRVRRAMATAAIMSGAAAVAHAQASTTDPRAGLKGGFTDAASAIRNLELVAHGDKPAMFNSTAGPRNLSFANSDLAFRGSFVFQGNFAGFQIWDISNPTRPMIRTSFLCPGGQGDPSIYGNLLFISVEETRGRIDCGTSADTNAVSAVRFRGVRIFDVTDIDHPKQVAAVQTCRGSHTHTLVENPKDKKSIYVYVSGTSVVRSASELAGCSGLAPDQDPNTSLFRIDVIRVPLARPADAKIVANPRLFADPAGTIAGLSKGNTTDTTHVNAETNRCHDITVYPAIGLAAGACAGNGILIDIKDPANPKRLDAASDVNFSFWHSATFSNDGSKVIFTDEWGGGTSPRCRVTDKPEWGADALFTIKDNKLTFASYFKLPVAQTDVENCVAHNGGLIPVPGRDIMVQGWYQGGLSVIDFTDIAHPTEIAWFDRGPIDPSSLITAGFWAGYWYNGYIVGTEIGRGLDIFRLKPSEWLSQNEIDAANTIRFEFLNAQDQPKLVWPASFPLARAYLDQLVRSNGLAGARTTAIGTELASAERLAGSARRAALTKLATDIDKDATTAAEAPRVKWLAAAVRDLARAK
jgi:hypothetical protein